MERFDGVPVWHASVAKHQTVGGLISNRLVPVGQWSRKDFARARELLAQVLEGVGLPNRQVEERLPASLQARRLASDAERRVIGPTKDMRQPALVACSSPGGVDPEVAS